MVGAGPAGLACATTLAERGHRVPRRRHVGQGGARPGRHRLLLGAVALLGYALDQGSKELALARLRERAGFRTQTLAAEAVKIEPVVQTGAVLIG